MAEASTLLPEQSNLMTLVPLVAAAAWVDPIIAVGVNVKVGVSAADADTDADDDATTSLMIIC